uniref:Uncharacterized protein n=1 Tax=Arion vulgaris TaxID=1028688 RepID=A0A0B6YUQ3_9EUPU
MCTFKDLSENDHRVANTIFSKCEEIIARRLQVNKNRSQGHSFGTFLIDPHISKHAAKRQDRYICKFLDTTLFMGTSHRRHTQIVYQYCLE